eukprot:scaffold98291_cov32-Tisochrysis_lutea.AAC.2
MRDASNAPVCVVVRRVTLRAAHLVVSYAARLFNVGTRHEPRRLTWDHISFHAKPSGEHRRCGARSASACRARRRAAGTRPPPQRAR